jgi:hypothetical protein
MEGVDTWIKKEGDLASTMEEMEAWLKEEEEDPAPTATLEKVTTPTSLDDGIKKEVLGEWKPHPS